MPGAVTVQDPVHLDYQVTVNADGSLNVKLAAGTAVIGHVITDTGSTTLATGNVSNANSGVATTATNVPVVAYMMGKNGSVWDPLDTTTPAQTYVSNSFLNVAAGTATTVVKSGAGTIASISINTVGIGNTLTLYDNTAGSGTKIATINTAGGIGQIPYGGAISTGITCVSTGGTGADYTVFYR